MCHCMNTIKNSLLIMIFTKQPLHNPTPLRGLIEMFLWIKIELVNEKPIGKCLTFSYHERKMLLCLKIALSWYQIRTTGHLVRILLLRKMSEPLRFDKILTLCRNLLVMEVLGKNIYYYYFTPDEFFGTRVTASLLRSPGLFSLFWSISILL